MLIFLVLDAFPKYPAHPILVAPAQFGEFAFAFEFAFAAANSHFGVAAAAAVTAAASIIVTAASTQPSGVW